MVLAVRVALTLATLSTSCLCWLGYASGIWSPHPELHRTGSHTKGVHRPKCFGGVKIGVPSRILTGNLTLRTRRLCGLSYEDRLRTEASCTEPHLTERIYEDSQNPNGHRNKLFRGAPGRLKDL